MGHQDAHELALRPARGVVQHRAIQRGARAGGVPDGEGDRAAPVLEEDQIAERRVLRAPRHDRAVGPHRRRDRRRELADAAVEEELFDLRARRQRRGVGVTRLVVMARPALHREGRRLVRRHVDGVPRNAAVATAAKRQGDRCMRVPLGDRAVLEPDVHLHRDVRRRVEIEDRGFHSHRAGHPALVVEDAPLDEARQIARSALRQPSDRGAILAGNGRERAPLVDGERRQSRRRLRRGKRGNDGGTQGDRGKAGAHLVLLW